MTDSSVRPADADRGQQRRNQVLDAAAACFRRYGFHGCSMAQMAKEAGMSVGHIYHYFPNKEAIIDAIVKRDLYECLEAIDQLAGSADVFRDMVQGLDEPIANSLDPDNAALQFEILAEASRNPKVAEMVLAAHQHVHDKVAELIRRGSPKPLTPQQLDSKIELTGALFDGLMAHALRAPQIDRTALVELMRSTLLHILNY